MKYTIIVTIILIKCWNLSAQEQAAVFSQYQVAPILITPAVAGFNDEHTIQMNLRTAWVGFPGAPKTYGVQYHGPIGKTLGVGLGVLSETIGSTTRFRLQMNYAFHYAFERNNKETAKIGLGFSTDFHQFRIADPQPNSATMTEEGLIGLGYDVANDDRIQSAIDGESIFDAALGIWGTIQKRTFIGLTFPNLIVAKIGDIESGESQGSFFRSVIFNFGHKFDVAGSNLTIEPSLMIRKMLDVPLQAHFNVVGGFLNEQLLAGLSFQAGTGGQMGLILGTKIDVLRFYYSFDLGFQNFQQYSSGSHELTVAFTFAKSKKKFDRD